MFTINIHQINIFHFLSIFVLIVKIMMKFFITVDYNYGQNYGYNYRVLVLKCTFNFYYKF